MSKKPKNRWLKEPEEHDYPAAESYLTLLYDQQTVAGFIKKLKPARVELLPFIAASFFRMLPGTFALCLSRNDWQSRHQCRFRSVSQKRVGILGARAWPCSDACRHCFSDAASTASIESQTLAQSVLLKLPSSKSIIAKPAKQLPVAPIFLRHVARFHGRAAVAGYLRLQRHRKSADINMTSVVNRLAIGSHGRTNNTNRLFGRLCSLAEPMHRLPHYIPMVIICAVLTSLSAIPLPSFPSETPTA